MRSFKVFHYTLQCLNTLTYYDRLTKRDSFCFSHNPVVLGEGGGNLPQIVLIFAETFRRDAFDDDGKEVARRMCSIIRRLEVHTLLCNFSFRYGIPDDTADDGPSSAVSSLVMTGKKKKEKKRKEKEKIVYLDCLFDNLK